MFCPPRPERGDRRATLQDSPRSIFVNFSAHLVLATWIPVPQRTKTLLSHSFCCFVPQNFLHWMEKTLFLCNSSVKFTKADRRPTFRSGLKQKRTVSSVPFIYSTSMFTRCLLLCDVRRPLLVTRPDVKTFWETSTAKNWSSDVIK